MPSLNTAKTYIGGNTVGGFWEDKMAGTSQQLSTFDQLKRHIKTHAYACDDIVRDIAEDGCKALYNIDFSVLYPILSANPLRVRSAEAMDDFDGLAYETLTLAPNYKNLMGVQFVMSFPAYLELLDHVDRRLSHLTKIKDDSGRGRKLFEELTHYKPELELGRIQDKDLIGSAQLQQKLRGLIANLPNGTEGQNVATILSLVNNNVVCGLGDFFTPAEVEAARNGRQYYRSVLDKIDRYRGQRQIEPEREEAAAIADFHRKIDAWTITLSKQLHDIKEATNVMFVGPNKLRMIYEKRSEELSRNIIAPFIRLKTLSMASSTHNVDQESRHRIHKLVVRLMEAWQVIEGAQSTDDLYTPQAETVREAYEQIGKVYAANPEDLRAGAEHRRQLIADLLKSPRAMRDKAAEVEEEMRSAVRKMLSFSPEPLNDNVLEAYDVKDNKRMRQIMKKFNSL
jgi:hypothetical protein